MIGQDLPALAIRRPLLVLVLNLLIALAGLAAILGVEVRELPDIDRPIVTVRGNLPGASPETVDVEVTAPVEGAVARVAGVREVRSSSEEGNFRIRVVFSPNVDLDSAAGDVREAVSRIERELPEGVEQLTVIKADADASPVMRLAASSRTLSEEDLTRIVEKTVIPALVSVDGIATVNLFGDRKRLLRVVVDPLRLSSFGLSVSEVAAALRSAPFDLPAGSFRSVDQELIVRADASVVTGNPPALDRRARRGARRALRPHPALRPERAPGRGRRRACLRRLCLGALRGPRRGADPARGPGGPSRLRHRSRWGQPQLFGSAGGPHRGDPAALRRKRRGRARAHHGRAVGPQPRVRDSATRAVGGANPQPARDHA